MSKIKPTEDFFIETLEFNFDDDVGDQIDNNIESAQGRGWTCHWPPFKRDGKIFLIYTKPMR